MTRKGIILAGGSGTRLYPLTASVSKQLLPVYDKPMIYYPLATLMLAGLKQILIISTERDKKAFEALLGTGHKWGIELTYAVQSEPNGIAEAFIIGRKFIGNDPVTLILGDNIFYGEGMVKILQDVSESKFGATIFGYYVNNPRDYGVVSFDGDGLPVDIQEKPLEAKSNYAVTGLYFYNNEVVEIASSLSPSQRGELEITEINNYYLQKRDLDVRLFSRGTAWLDTGQKDSLLDAANFVKIVEERQGLKIACPEEIAYEMGFITPTQLEQIIHACTEGSYQEYLKKIIKRTLS